MYTYFLSSKTQFQISNLERPATLRPLTIYSQMIDINEVRKQISAQYNEACGKINHESNRGIIRALSSPVPKTFYLDIVYRGNDKINFSHRMTDKDVILLSDVLKNRVDMIRNVDLSYNQIGDIGLEMFSKLLKECNALESVNLQGNNISKAGTEALCEALNSAANLKYLNLSYNKIQTEGVISVTKNLLFSNKAESKKPLQELNLCNNEINADGMIVVTSVLNWNNNSLKVLNVDSPLYQSIGQETAIHFAKMLQINRGLEKLSLKKHDFTCAAMHTITQHLLDNNKLKVLDLTANKIAFQGCQELARYLTGKYCALESLILASNRTGHYGAKAISQALSKNRSLIHLDMTRNDIDDSGLKFIAQSLQTNDTLVSLKLYWNHFGQQSLKEFHKLSKKNDKQERYWDFTTYIVDNEISMGLIETKINYDVDVSKQYYCP